MINAVATRFAAVASLDVAPRDCYQVYEGLAASIRSSYARLAAILNRLDGTPGTRLAEVLDLAPHVVTGAAGYVWLNQTYEALARNNRPGLDSLLDHFARFEAAAAMSTSSDWEGPYPFETPVRLPGTDTVISSTAGKLVVVGGVPQAEHWSLPAVGSLIVDGYEPLLRNPRSMSQFDLAEPSLQESRASARELNEARDLANKITPTLFDRYITDVVPLVAEPDMAHAGTDDASPWAVYLSFGRQPADLIAALAHEESHALVQTLGKLVPDLLPDSEATMPVPWKTDVRRSLAGVLHGLIAFGRAATVRSRAARAGADSPQNAEALEREYRWISEVTEQLLDGELGKLPDGLDQWLAANLASVDTSPPQPQHDIQVLARDGERAAFAWRLIAGGGAHVAAGELFPRATRTQWSRGVPGHPDQDRADFAGTPHRFLTHEIPALIEREWSTAAELASVKVHRLRTGDRIRPHTDGQHDGLIFRTVLGLTPHDLRSGELRLLTQEHEPILATQPQFGQAIVFELADPSYHEVLENRSEFPRFTLIASYRARP